MRIGIPESQSASSVRSLTTDEADEVFVCHTCSFAQNNKTISDLLYERLGGRKKTMDNVEAQRESMPLCPFCRTSLS
jgi:hypothetical protein